MLDHFDRPLFLIGCGAMAGAMLSRWLESGLRPSNVTVLRPSGRPVSDGVKVITALPEQFPDSAIIILGMKPQQLGVVAPEIKARWRSDLTLLSLLAGVSVARLGMAGFPKGQTIRVMPNTPVALGRGVCALYADPAMDEDQRDYAVKLLSPLGLAEWIEDEDQFNLVTALTGCGPAFLFRFIDALAQGATTLGLAPEQALRFSTAMVDGAAALAKNAGEGPGALADKVASKGGMTREGLDILDAEHRLATLILDTLRAARDRGQELEKLSG